MIVFNYPNENAGFRAQYEKIVSCECIDRVKYRINVLTALKINHSRITA